MLLPNYPKSVYDQLQRTLILPAAPQRIISLVPSQTELLFDLGLREEVVGITKFCIHPSEWFRTKTRVGGTKQYDFNKIKALHPDLIIGNKEENEEQAIKQLMEQYPVWMSDIQTLADALDMIKSIAGLVDKEDKANSIIQKLSSSFNELEASQSLSLPEQHKPVAYFIWKKPYMVAGHSTFINEMLRYCNFKNVFASLPSRYPEISPDALITANPQVVLLSSEPYPFKQKHVDEFKTMLPAAKIIIVDGELFSWYGSRLLQTPAYLRKIANSVGE